jgi:hypothetical protein
MKYILLLFLATSLLYAKPTVTTNKNEYAFNDSIIVSLTQMEGQNEDWIGVYPVEANNDWENVVAWNWTGDIAQGDVTLSPIQKAGTYEVRAFYNNSFQMEAKSAPFTVIAQQLPTTLTLPKTLYRPTENIIVHFERMSGDDEDWIGIYPKEKNNDWENVVAWHWSNGNISGNLNFGKLNAGEYEIRAFYANGFETKAKVAFQVTDEPLPPTIYEDAEDGTTKRWVNKGGYTAQNKNEGYNSAKSIYIRAKWKKVDGVWINDTHNELLKTDHTSWNNTTQKFLKFEHKTPYSPCFRFGIYVNTLEGKRTMTWSMWYARNNMPATKLVYEGGNVELMYPVNENMRFEKEWTPYTFDLEALLRVLEPQNRILSIDGFYATGGKYYDNIRLESEK